MSKEDEKEWTKVGGGKKKVLAKTKTGGRAVGTMNLSAAEKLRREASKNPVGRRSALAVAADPNTPHHGGVKQQKLNFGTATKISRRDDKSKSHSPKRKQRLEPRDGDEKVSEIDADVV
jgi:hypothetical protein